ncbi:hypothetical protein TPDSL_17950 [Terrisporobacter petrolearius]|uniref:DUF4355 domain-containing protein n=1 Tax=Terrisporobacter petrolearius TaxID=1460447 RepID=UPI0033694D17
MLKSELLELVKDIDDNTDIDEVVSKNYLTLDNFKSKLDESEFKSFLDSQKDKHSSKAIATALENFKTKDMQKLIDAEVLKRTGDNETPEQKQIRELQQQFEALQKEKTHAEMVSKYKDVLNEKKIPSQLVDFLLADDEDITNANIDLFENSMKTFVDSKVEERMKDTSYTPPENKGDVGKLTMEDLKNMTPDEINKNWERISE